VDFAALRYAVLLVSIISTTFLTFYTLKSTITPVHSNDLSREGKLSGAVFLGI